MAVDCKRRIRMDLFAHFDAVVLSTKISVAIWETQIVQNILKNTNSLGVYSVLTSEATMGIIWDKDPSPPLIEL